MQSFSASVAGSRGGGDSFSSCALQNTDHWGPLKRARRQMTQSHVPPRRLSRNFDAEVLTDVQRIFFIYIIFISVQIKTTSVANNFRRHSILNIIWLNMFSNQLNYFTSNRLKLFFLSGFQETYCAASTTVLFMCTSFIWHFDF